MHTWRKSHVMSQNPATQLSCWTASWHVATKFMVPENITLVHLPPHSPELNPVENIWEYLRKNKLALRVHDNYDAIVEAFCQAWNGLMVTPERIASIATRHWSVMS